MTDRDWGTTSRRGPQGLSLVAVGMPEVGVHVATRVAEQLRHRGALVVASDIGVKIEPETFDAVVVWAA